jgi:transcriptional regulator with XRE-family HTH domain
MYQEFGELLKKYRLENKLKQKELLKQLKKSYYADKYQESDISKWEHGRTRPQNGEVVEILEDILKIPSSLLLKAAGYYSAAELYRNQVSHSSSSIDDTDHLRLNAREKHFEDLCNFAERCRKSIVGDSEAGHHPSAVIIPFSSKDIKKNISDGRDDLIWTINNDYSVKVWFRWERKTRDRKLYECLRSHLGDNARLWVNYDELKRLLLHGLSKVATMTVIYPETNWRSGNIQKIRELVDIINGELELLSLQRVLPGKCPACPD